MSLKSEASGSEQSCNEIAPRLSDWQDEPCPCYCGSGITKSKRECIWYEQTDDLTGCVERRSSDDDKPHPCGNALLTMEKDFYYLAYTDAGQTCDIGKLDLEDVNDRQRGKID